MRDKKRSLSCFEEALELADEIGVESVREVVFRSMRELE